MTAFIPGKLFLTLVAACQQGPQLLSLCLSISLQQLQRSQSNKCPPLDLPAPVHSVMLGAQLMCWLANLSQIHLYL